MKLKFNYILSEVGDVTMAVPIDNNEQNRHMLRLNKTAISIFKDLEKGLDNEEIAKNLATNFDIDYNSALKDVNNTIDKLIEGGIVVID